MARKPPPTFSILFKGKDVFPERIPSSRVAYALKAIQHLIHIGLDEVDEGDYLRLLDVHRGSARFQCFVPDDQHAIRNLELTGRMLSEESFPNDMAERARPVESLSRLARTLGCEIVLERGKDVLAKVAPDSYDTVFGKLLVSGETTLVGKVVRVGGATRDRCSLRREGYLALLYCDVGSDDVARKLGNHLKEIVTVRGLARWLKTSWAIVGFRIDDVTPPHKRDFAASFRRIRAAGGNAWDSVVDPDSFIQDLRK